MIKVDNDTGEIRGPFIRSAYNYPMDAVSRETGLACTDVTRTQQQFAEECDINTIIRRFGLTGELPENLRVPQSGDFTSVHDFQSAMNAVRAAEEAFMEMPADVRERFNNDPGRFLAFVHDDKNRDEAAKLGLLVPPAVPPEPLEVVVREKKAPKEAAKEPPKEA